MTKPDYIPCGVVMACGRPKYHRGHCGGFRPVIDVKDAVLRADPILERTDLTPGELAILKDIATGITYAEVAHRRAITLQTVKNHLHIIYTKLEAASAIEALAKVGWLRVPADVLDGG
jgi:DNA-binding NarL/FixJ family response regulator